MPEKPRRYFLKDKEVKSLIAKASEKLKIDVSRTLKNKTGFEVVETESVKILLANGRPVLIESGETVYPTLIFGEFCAAAPKVIVDMGAIPFVCKGANVMAPGIRRLEGEFGKGDLVLVMDEKHGKAIAVGEALLDSENARKTKQGSIVKNLHFVSDKTWNLIKNL